MPEVAAHLTPHLQPATTPRRASSGLGPSGHAVRDAASPCLQASHCSGPLGMRHSEAMPAYDDLPPMSGEVITSTANPRVKHLVELRKRRARDASGLTVIDGYDELVLAI